MLHRTIRLVKNVSSNLATKTKRQLYALSHYKFRERLQHQSEKYGVKLLIVSEYNTTKMCSNCKKLNNPGKSKTYSCDCGLTVDRDAIIFRKRNIISLNINAAKNIRYV
ncbi:MAG: hypothetical protein EOP34_08215 [Rickettsiales bacterium]|nr:MAG: hypothetical protein EOP34_08215 [Rickettsiales bacterium]